MKRFLVVFWAFSIIWGVLSQAQADVIDPYDNINAPPGANALITYWNYYHLPEFSPKNGDDIDIDVDVSVLAVRPVHFFSKKLAGHSWGLNAILPLGHCSMDNMKNSTGLGDIIVGPFIYLVENEKDNVYLSFWEFIQAPTGQYDKDKATNIGTDRWFFEHELAFGWYPGRFGVDANLNYWQFLKSKELKEERPDALELEAVLHYGITDKFRIGIQGAAWWDMDDYKYDGIKAEDTKGTNYKLGINLGYSLQENLILNLRYMKDIKSDNFTEGSHAYFKITYLF